MKLNGLRVNENLMKVPLYIAGKSIQDVREEYGLQDVLKLASNENPLGPSPMATQALVDSVSQAHRYPGSAEKELRKQLAVQLGEGITENHIIIGNGATDLLRLITQAFVFDGGETVMSSVSFPMFWIFTEMFGGTAIKVSPAHDMQIDLNAIRDAVNEQTRIVWLCSPNNPTGLVLHQQEVDEFIGSLPEHVLVVLDESYLDYVTDPQKAVSLVHVRENRNLLALRSFSKSGGLANLRVGYGIAYPELIEYLLHARLPFNNSSISLKAAAASLGDIDFHERSVALVIEERQFLYDQLRRLGLKCILSQANFILIYDLPTDDGTFAEELMKLEVILRPMTAFGKPNAVRVTVGRRDQNERFLSAIALVLEQERMKA